MTAIWGWLCQPCAAPVLWGPGMTPYASIEDEGACHGCGRDCKGERREWRPMPSGVPRHAASRPEYARAAGFMQPPPAVSTFTPKPMASPQAGRKQLSLF